MPTKTNVYASILLSRAQAIAIGQRASATKAVAITIEETNVGDLIAVSTTHGTDLLNLRGKFLTAKEA